MSKIQKLNKIATSFISHFNAHCFKTLNDEKYIVLNQPNLREVIKIKSQDFADILQDFCTQNQTHLARHDIEELKFQIVSQNVLKQKVENIYTRIYNNCEFGNPDFATLNCIIDLNQTGNNNAVLVDKSVKKVIQNTEVNFVRPKKQRPLPDPDFNISQKEFFSLFCETFQVLNPSVLLAILTKYYLKFIGPNPIIKFTGPPQSGKSSCTRLIVELMDDRKPQFLMFPDDEQSFQIQAKHSGILAYDNTETLNKKQSNNLNVAVTGGGASGRTLYENDEEFTMVLSAAIVVNGIPPLSVKSDTISRVVEIELKPIGKGKFKSGGSLSKDLEKKKPLLLGGLFNTIHEVIKILPKFENCEFDSRFGEFTMIAMAIDELFPSKKSVVSQLNQLYEQQKNDHAMSDELIVTILSYLDKLEQSSLKSGLFSPLGGPKLTPLKGNSVQVLELLRKFAKNGINSSLPRNGKHFLSELEMRKGELYAQGIAVIRSNGKANKNGIMLEISKINTKKTVDDNDDGDDFYNCL